jgi:hypothetical protein
MSAKRAKLNLDFGHSGISMNYAMEKDIQSRRGDESEWSVGMLSFNTQEFEDFPGVPQNRIDESVIKIISSSFEKIITEWQEEFGYDFDSLMEVTISASFFDVLFFPYSLKFSKFKDITESDMKKIEECKQADRISHTPIPGEKIKSFVSPYFTILNEKSATVRLLNPIGRKTQNLGFHAYFITEHPMLSRLLEVMKEDGDKIKVSLSCEREFMALANKKERESRTVLIHITDSISEFSMWEKSELKYLNKKDTGFRDLKEIIWRLCICYHKKPELAEHDFELTQKIEYMQKFYNNVKNTEISDDSKELLSADDCSELLEFVSCLLEHETEEGFKYSRFKLPQSKIGLTISNYVLSYFARETIRSLMLEIKRILYSDDFCEPEYIILESPLPLKGIEKLAYEVFEIPARKALAKWDGEPREDLSSAGIGSLKSLISGEEHKNSPEDRKKTSKLHSFLNIFSRAS